MIFGLRNVRSRRLKVLISAYAYNTLLVKVSRSVLFVDEAWIFMETPSIVGFIYITQRTEDLVRSPQGNTRAVRYGTPTEAGA